MVFECALPSRVKACTVKVGQLVVDILSAQRRELQQQTYTY